MFRIFGPKKERLTFDLVVKVKECAFPNNVRLLDTYRVTLEGKEGKSGAYSMRFPYNKGTLGERTFRARARLDGRFSEYKEAFTKASAGEEPDEFAMDALEKLYKSISQTMGIHYGYGNFDFLGVGFSEDHLLEPGADLDDI